MKYILIFTFISIIAGQLYTQELPCNYVINETFPNSSIEVQGKKASTSFSTTVSGLEVGETYILKFYQLNNEPLSIYQLDYPPYSEVFIPESAYWGITLGTTPPKRSPYAVSSRNPMWEQVVLTFVPTSSTEQITFRNILGYSYDEDNPNQDLLLADIRFHLQGECVSGGDISCENTSSFKPQKGKKYVLSGWVKEKRAQQVVSYTESGIGLSFGGDSGLEFKPSGAIIEGWQLIQGIFTIPDTSTGITLHLNPASNGTPTFFDDIRIHPVNGNMKSFVYDQQTQRLTSELDENNYATFYEYDKEGGLIRVKKETERGIFTIQETRSSNAKAQ